MAECMQGAMLPEYHSCCGMCRLRALLGATPVQDGPWLLVRQGGCSAASSPWHHGIQWHCGDCYVMGPGLQQDTASAVHGVRRQYGTVHSVGQMWLADACALGSPAGNVTAVAASS